MNEMLNFASYRGLSRAEARSEVGDSAHDGVVAGFYHNASGAS